MYIILNKPKVMKKDQNKKFTVYNKIQLKVEKLDNNDKLQYNKDLKSYILSHPLLILPHNQVFNKSLIFFKKMIDKPLYLSYNLIIKF